MSRELRYDVYDANGMQVAGCSDPKLAALIANLLNRFWTEQLT
jgi:hypothetical protein